MVKKTKMKKGGKTFLEKLLGKTIEGPFIADDINYNIKKGRSVALKEEYKLRKELADEDYKLAENKLKNEEDKNQKIADRDFKYNKLNQDNFNFKLRLFWDFLITIASAIKDSIAKFFNFLMKTFGTVIIPGGKAIFDIYWYLCWYWYWYWYLYWYWYWYWWCCWSCYCCCYCVGYCYCEC